MSDLSTLTDEELDTEFNAIINEKERRKNLEQIPTQIEELKKKFIDGGGVSADIA